MLNSPLLGHVGSHIAGRWVRAAAAGRLTKINPATGEALAEVPLVGPAEATRAVEAAAAAMRRPVGRDERRRWLEAIGARLEENKSELARIITLEHGKTLRESQAEVEYAASFYRYYASQIDHLESRHLAERIRACRWTVHHRPAGVAAFITPWNFPLGMLSKKLSAALAAGCASVTKPASLTPLTAVALWSILEQVGLPAGMANLVIGRSEPIGQVLCTHPAVRVVSFTGSTEVGRALLRLAGDHLKRTALELGGCAPLVVFNDADLEAATQGLMASKFRCSGQTCVSVNRVYVQSGVAEELTDRVVAGARRIRVGNGLDPASDIGPLINREAFDKVAAHVHDALCRGATRLVGEDPPRPAHEWGAFYPATVLTGVTQKMRVFREETFGPVVPIGRFDDEAQVLAWCNDTPFGLAAYVFTRDLERGQRIVAGLQFGHVGLNTGGGPTPQAPFGGMKQSGFGREGGLEGLLEFCETQVVATAD